PLANPECSGALYAPTAAVIDPFGAVFAAAENAVTNGVTYSFETEFLDFIAENGVLKGIKTNKGDFYCKAAVNAAGLYSDEVASKAGDARGFSITPYKGSYFVFDAAKIVLNSVLFPVPGETTKGILVSTTTHGNVLIGPDKEPALSKEDSSTTEEGLKKILEGAKKLVPSIDVKNVIASYAGIRASGNTGDFVIEESKALKGLINLMGIDSPGLASAPAIALEAVELVKLQIANCKLKLSWNPIRQPKVHFHMLSNAEKAELVKKNPAYGRIVCRCEEITEGEVLDAIHSPIPARTYDGIKRRTWLGTGRCQGAFDYPRVIQILAKELGIPVEKVSKKGKGSEIVFRKTKEI
ncbi:MAG TPA: FAD-dependent oxidoreductase, partial [Candidatus Goldiibacteriota bacterium]|nr:FAD-dependent oxidoreductase [Candidatus Goldiibacteriota bacterium]